MIMMDSMCNAELDGDGKIFHTQPSRIVRIAIGSGHSVRAVEEMLSQFKKFAQLVKKMGGKNGLFKTLGAAGAGGGLGGLGGGAGGPSNMAQAMRMLQQNPQAMRQLGGMGNLQNMMRQMQQGGGAFGEMMKKFGGGG